MPERIGASLVIANSKKGALPGGESGETVINGPVGLSIIAGDALGFTTREVRGDMIVSLVTL